MKLDTEKTTVYLPLRLKSAIAKKAKAEHRSDNSQVVHALEDYFFGRAREDPVIPQIPAPKTETIAPDPSRKIVTPHRGGAKQGNKPVSTYCRQATRRKSA